MSASGILERSRRAASRAGRSAVTNGPLALVSIALATLLWVAVTSAENPTLRRQAPFEVPVESVSIPRSFVVTGMSPEKVSVTLIGPRERVSNIRPDDLDARVNLTGAVSPASTASGPLRLLAPASVTVRARGVRAEVTPASIEVTLAPEVRRVVPVRINRVDALPVGYELAEPPAAQPSEVTVAGARENVDLVDAATADVKLSGLTVNVSENVALEPRDSAGHAIGQVTVDPSVASVSLKIRQDAFARQLLVDPRVHGRPAPGYTTGSIRIDPPTVSVSGSLDALGQISTLPTQDVDVEGATSDVVRTVTLQLPPGVSLNDPKTSVVVRVPVQPQSGPGAIGVVPKISGVGAGLSATSQTPTLLVNLTGPLPALLRLTAADLTATVDASGLGPGVYRLEPKVALPPGLQLDGVVPDRVAVTIAASAAPR